MQSEKFDPNGEYIKKWLPSLALVCPEDLHRWDIGYGKYNLEEIDYIEPIINYEEARWAAKQAYGALAKKKGVKGRRFSENYSKEYYKSITKSENKESADP